MTSRRTGHVSNDNDNFELSLVSSIVQHPFNVDIHTWQPCPPTSVSSNSPIQKLNSPFE